MIGLFSDPPEPKNVFLHTDLKRDFQANKTKFLCRQNWPDQATKGPKIGSFFALVDRKMSQAQIFSPFLVDPLGAYKTAKKIFGPAHVYGHRATFPYFAKF